MPFAFAPYRLLVAGHPDACAAAGVVARLRATRAAWRGFWFAAGQFGVGTYWLYISIHGFGQAPIWLALLLMLALVAIMSLYQALLGWSDGPLARALAADVRAAVGAGAVELVEWLRGWLLSGFSWLSLGVFADRFAARRPGAARRHVLA